MRWFIISLCFSMLLRRQLEIIQRKLDKPLRVSRAEKFSLAILTLHLKRITGQSIKKLSEVIRSFQPETVLKWHRELVRRKWVHREQAHTGRPKTDATVERLVLQFTHANEWGNSKIAGGF